jgi:hypothetical protein
MVGAYDMRPFLIPACGGMTEMGIEFEKADQADRQQPRLQIKRAVAVWRRPFFVSGE